MTVLITAINELAAAVLPALWRASWQGGLALLLVFILCRAMRRIPAQAQCWLWRLAYVKLLIAGLWIVPVELRWLPLPEPTADATPTVHAIEPSPPPLVSPIAESAVEDAVVTAPLRGRVARSASTADVVPRLSGLGWLLIAWMAGVTFMLANLTRHGLRVRRLLSRLSPVTRGAIAGRLSAHCRQMRVRRPPQVRIAEGASSPFLVGVLRPVIVLPAAIVESCTPDELDAVLIHELAHIRRRDLLWNWLPALAETTFFFHPLLWLTRRDWRLAQEIATDELAVSASRVDAAQYAKSLIALVSKSPDATNRPHLAVALSEAYTQLARRMTAMQTFQPLTPHRRITIAATVLTFAAAGLVPWKITAQDAPSAAEVAPTPDQQEVAAEPVEKPAAEEATVRGIVQDDAGRPVSGATIVTGLFRGGDTRQQTQRTDAQGRFETPFTFDERPLVVAHKERLSIAGQFVRERDPEAEPLVLILSKPEPFVGRVQDQNGNPIPGATVRIEQFTTDHVNEFSHWNHLIELILTDSALDKYVRTKTDADGEFRFSVFPRGTQAMLKVGAEGMGLFRSMMYRERERMFLPGTPTDPAIVTLEEEGVITGQVVTSLPGVSVEGLNVHLQQSNNSMVIADPYFVRTDSQGRFRFDRLAEGTANVFVVDHEPDGPWTYRAAQDVNVFPGERAEIVIELIMGQIVKGEVVDPLGNPIAGVGVGVYAPIRPRSGAAILSYKTKDDGKYRFHLPSGAAYIYTSGLPEGFEERGDRETIQVPAGEGVIEGPLLVVKPADRNVVADDNIRANGRAGAAQGPVSSYDGHFERMLSRTDAGPVFMDIDSGRFFVPPPDVVGPDYRVRPLEEWRFFGKIQSWIRSHGVDVAAQSDGSEIKLISFDMREGEQFPHETPLSELTPEAVAASVSPVRSDREAWIVGGHTFDVSAESTWSAKLPFVTREGGIGTLWLSRTEDFVDSRGPNCIRFDYQLSRNRDVPTLTQQPILDAPQSAILGSFWGNLIADMHRDKLRIRLPGSADSVEVGNDLVEVYTPSGIIMRCARINTGYLDIDATSNCIDIFGHGKQAIIERAGDQIRIELEDGTAQGDRLTLSMPDLRLYNRRGLGWSPKAN